MRVLVGTEGFFRLFWWFNQSVKISPACDLRFVSVGVVWQVTNYLLLAFTKWLVLLKVMVWDGCIGTCGVLGLTYWGLLVG